MCISRKTERVYLGIPQNDFKQKNNGMLSRCSNIKQLL